ncbi:hypothetical protein VUR80DRAFT_8608 [Thermomyces stellatus]
MPVRRSGDLGAGGRDTCRSAGFTCCSSLATLSYCSMGWNGGGGAAQWVLGFRTPGLDSSATSDKSQITQGSFPNIERTRKGPEGCCPGSAGVRAGLRVAEIGTSKNMHLHTFVRADSGPVAFHAISCVVPGIALLLGGVSRFPCVGHSRSRRLNPAG